MQFFRRGEHFASARSGGRLARQISKAVAGNGSALCRQAKRPDAVHAAFAHADAAALQSGSLAFDAQAADFVYDQFVGDAWG
ncbi:MAG: hypothetical protein WCA21_07855 [Terracidiphilus sp.]